MPPLLTNLSAYGEAPSRARSLLVHGMSDDNVVVAHPLRMSAALLAADHEH
jgi:dipeptidyl-peptidase-4